MRLKFLPKVAQFVRFVVDPSTAQATSVRERMVTPCRLLSDSCLKLHTLPQQLGEDLFHATYSMARSRLVLASDS